MANNRIYLKCNACGKTLYLGKSFMSGYCYVNYDRMSNRFAKSLEAKLNDFYEEHTYCGLSLNDGDFSIEYEFPLDRGDQKEVTKEEAIEAVKHIMYSSPHESTEEVVRKKYYSELLIAYIEHTDPREVTK